MNAEQWIAEANRIMDLNEEYMIEFNNVSSCEGFYHDMKYEAQRRVNQNNHLRAGIKLLCTKPT